jgi:hypothetical protein
MKRVGIDWQTWNNVKTMMRAAADGTARDVVWEYPCQSSNGVIGELKHEEAGEVRYIDDANGIEVVESAMIRYRVYINEPNLCPEELWAMGFGAKSHHPHYPSTNQQTDIELATLRASQTDQTGRDLPQFNP